MKALAKILKGPVGWAVVLVVSYFIVKRLSGEAVEVVTDVGQAINPTNPDNIFYAGVNEVGEALSGDENFNLGVATFEAEQSFKKNVQWWEVAGGPGYALWQWVSGNNESESLPPVTVAPMSGGGIDMQTYLLMTGQAGAT